MDTLDKIVVQLSLLHNRDRLVNRFSQIVNDAISEYSPSAIFAAYSGGEDSAVVVQLCKEIGINFSAMTIDTGIGSVGHMARIMGDMQRANVPLIIYTGNGLEWYIKNVEVYGFGYTPAMHSVYYRNLKERAINTCTREHKQHRLDRVMFITGVRRAESFKRAKTPLKFRVGSRVSVNAIAEFSDSDKYAILENIDWWKHRTTHDCLCNWTRNHTVDELPEITRRRIEELNAEMKALGLWGYGEKPTREQLMMMNNDNGDDELNGGDWCVNCRRLL